MVKVYFESGNHAELVASFQDAEVYIACLPILKVIAEELGMKVTESIE